MHAIELVENRSPPEEFFESGIDENEVEAQSQKMTFLESQFGQ